MCHLLVPFGTWQAETLSGLLTGTSDKSFTNYRAIFKSSPVPWPGDFFTQKLIHISLDFIVPTR